LPHPQLPYRLTEFTTGVFAAAIGVHDAVLFQLPAPGRHPQCRRRQLGAVVVRHRPADHLARGRVDAGRQIQLSFQGDGFGHVTDQPHPRPRSGEVPADQVRGEDGAFRLPGQSPPVATGDTRDVVLPHQALHPLAVHDPPGPHQGSVDPRGAVGAARAGMQHPDLVHQQVLGPPAMRAGPSRRA
jgi:hypothetical protein